MTERNLSSSLIGLTTGGFEFIRELGQGGMSLVYQARQIDLERLVALKILRPELAHQPETVSRFHQEARSAARLDHPNLVPIYMIGELETPGGGHLHAIAMKYIQGRTLKDLLETEGRLDLPRAVGLLEQVGAALDYAHQQGVIHRDIKPSNMLISEQGTAYLSDFGLAFGGGSTTRLTKSGVVMGTPEYMSPEQAEGRATVGKATDMYALGVVLYEMLTGDLPFEADTPMGMLVARLTQEPRPLRSLRADLPPQVEQIIARALARDPEARFGSVAELLAELRSLPDLPASESEPTSSGQPFYAIPAHTGKTLALPQQAASDTPEPFATSDTPPAPEDSRPPWKTWLAPGIVAVVLLVMFAGVFVITGDFRSSGIATSPTPAPVSVVVVRPTPVPPPAGDDLTELLEIGWTRFENQRYNEAEELFSEATRLSSTYPEAWYGLGRAQLEQGNYDQAVVSLREAIRLDEQTAAYHTWQGEAFLQSAIASDTPASREAARQAYDNAAQAYRRAISLENGAYQAHTGLAWVHHKLGDYSQARERFEQSLEVEYNQPEAHNGLGWTLYTLGDYRAAQSHFHIALDLNSTYANALYGLGLTKEELGQPGEARRAYEQALHIDPDMDDARERLNQLE